MKRSVVISGMGCISAAGNTINEFCLNIKSLLEKGRDARSGEFCKKKMVDVDYNDPKILKVLPRLDKACKFVLKATEQALAKLELEHDTLSKDSRTGIIIGSSYGVLSSQGQYLEKLIQTKIASPLYFQSTTQNLLSGIIAYKYGIKGFNLTIMNGWTSGIDALALGSQMILSNQLDRVIVGGVDVLSPQIEQTYNNMYNRDLFTEEFIPGEGCGVIILEAYNEHSNKGSIQGRLIEWGQGNYFNSEEIEQELSYVLNKTSDKYYYFTNLNGTKIDKYENKVLLEKKIHNKFEIKSFIGECAAASGMMQIIYAASLIGQTSIIFNVCDFGKYSYVIVKGESDCGQEKSSWK